MRDLEEAIKGIRKDENDIFQIIADLKLAEITVPLMKYVEQYSTEVSEEIKEKITSLKLQQEADILVVVEKFALLAREEKENLDIAFKRLTEIAKAHSYSKEVLAGLEQTITDAHFVESLK